MFAFDSETGRISVVDTPFARGSIGFRLETFSVKSTDLKWTVDADSFIARHLDCQLGVHIDGDSVSVYLQNNSQKDVYLEEIDLTFSPRDLPERLVVEEWMEYVCSFNFGPGSVKRVGLKNDFLPHNPKSSIGYVIFRRSTGESYIFHILPPHNGDYTTFAAMHDSAHMEGCFGVKITSTHQAVLQPGKTLRTTAIRVQKGDDPFELLSSLGDKWLENRQLPLKDTRIGWNSWDYFSGAVRPQDIYSNRDAAREYLGKDVKYFIIDEGYEPRWGVWAGLQPFSAVYP